MLGIGTLVIFPLTQKQKITYFDAETKNEDNQVKVFRLTAG
jgi:hypothetical protein